MAAPGSVRRRQRGAGLARPTVQRASLPVPLPVQPTGAECAALLKALIKHLLFQRAQIPYLYDELLRAAQEQQRAEAEAEAAAAAEAAAGGGRQRRRRRSPKGDKRLLKFLCKAEELLASIDAALAACGVPRRAFLLLGASSTKPREVFEVLLPQPAAATPHGPTAAAAGGPGHQQQGAAVHEAAPTPQAASRARPSRQQRLCQLAVRQLVVGGAELPEGTAHTVPCKLFVLLEGPPVAAAGAADTPDGAAEAAEVAVPAGFATKRQFRLSMRKGTHVRLLLGQRAEEDAEQQRAAEQAAEQQQQRQEEEGPVPASSEASMDGSGSSYSSGDGQEGGVTVHLSQLPDADSQGQAAAPGQQASSGGAARCPPAAAGAALAGASSTAGLVWFMARTVLKGLNSGSGSGGVAAGFDGL